MAWEFIEGINMFIIGSFIIKWLEITQNFNVIHKSLFMWNKSDQSFHFNRQKILLGVTDHMLLDVISSKSILPSTLAQ